MIECLIDSPLDVDGRTRISAGTQELFDPCGGLRSVDRQALPDRMFTGTFVLFDELRIVPRDEFGPNVESSRAGSASLPSRLFAAVTRQCSIHELATSLASVFRRTVVTSPVLNTRDEIR